MTPETITIILPLPNRVLQPNCTIGSFGGRMMKASASKKLRRQACEAIEAEGIESMPWEQIKVDAMFYHKTNRARDTDNAQGSLKAAYDGIVDSGLVVNDDRKHMRRGEPDFRIDKEFPRVVLTITRLE